MCCVGYPVCCCAVWAWACYLHRLKKRKKGDYSGTPSTNGPGGGSTSVGSTSNTMGHKGILGGGSTNDVPFLSTDDPGGGPPVRSPSNTMDNKDNLDDGSTNDDPGFRGNSNTSNTVPAGCFGYQ